MNKKQKIVKNIISLRKGDVMLLSSGIVAIKLLPECQVKLDDVKRFMHASVTLSDENPFVILLDGNATLEVSEQAMSYAANFKNDNWKAFAIVVRATSGKLYANYFLKFAGYSRPVKVFTAPSQASEWLQKHLK